MSDLATRIVDAIFDQWTADCGLTKAKAIERVQEVVSGYTVNKLPDGHAYIPIERYLGSQHFTVDDPPQDFTKPFQPYRWVDPRPDDDTNQF